ncbi:MAG: ribosome assembly cofactor RimP [Bacteroidetes bacterium HGW-Bacteroidetes-17]|jgi:ribosome maturation factor RimP|nr:MAG: ribosome assembly cofactor RimP [Bacteroidetes bacterium HGW-Bacteroidetes-17]
MIDKQLIVKLAESELKGTDKFLVNVSVNPGNKISVILDGDTSISIDDCIEISRFIESSLDREVEDFELSVSSAGLDQPLKLIRQYKKYKNKEISVLTGEGLKQKGILTGILNDRIQLCIPENKKKKTKEQNIEILFSDIKETKAIISFKK